MRFVFCTGYPTTGYVNINLDCVEYFTYSKLEDKTIVGLNSGEVLRLRGYDAYKYILTEGCEENEIEEDEDDGNQET